MKHHLCKKLFQSFSFNLSFHISLKVFLLKFRSLRCLFQSLNNLLTTLFFNPPLPMFIMPLFNEALFHIFQASFSEKVANPSSTLSFLFSSNSSCRLIFTAQTSVQFPHKDDAKLRCLYSSIPCKCGVITLPIGPL